MSCSCCCAWSEVCLKAEVKVNLTTGGALDSEEEAEAVGDAGSAQAPVDKRVRPV